MTEQLSQTTESVLFVDDEKHILSSIRRLMRPLKLNLFFAESGAEGLKILEENEIDLIVSDMRMPQMDGAEFLTKARAMQPETVRILLTGYADMNSTIEALNNGGIYRYISKPWNDDELKEVIENGLKLKRLERERNELLEITRKQNDELQSLNENLEDKVKARTKEVIQTSQMLDVAYKELRSSYDSFVLVFSNFINMRGTMQKSESKLVAELAQKMAALLKLKDKTIQRVYHASLLHQVGKMGLPDSVLSQSEDEMHDDDLAAYQKYPLVGETALSAISSFERTAHLIRSHTENYDGSGFPDGLKENEVLAGARIIRVAKDYIGLQTGIISRNKLKASQAFHYIEERGGTIYDPIAIKALKKLWENYDVSELYADEIEVHTLGLLPGMELTRDLVNSDGMLLISKGHKLNEGIISKIITLEEKDKETFIVYVSKDYQKTDSPTDGGSA